MRRTSMYNIEMREFIKIISAENNIPESEIKIIINSVFEFIRNTIKKESKPLNKKYPSFRVKNLGKFHVPSNVSEHVYKHLINKNETI